MLTESTDSQASLLARLRKKLGVNEFSDELPNGEPNDDYLEPFKGLIGMKESLSVYLMTSVHFAKGLTSWGLRVLTFPPANM